MLNLGKKPDTVFIGQAVAVPGTAMSQTLLDVDDFKKIELPVEEDFQLGISIGMAMNGLVPISIFPRWNFLLLATNQIVNHLDKLNHFYEQDALPKVIIRTSIGSTSPLHPGPQHIGDFTNAFRLMTDTVEVITLETKTDVQPAYQWAYDRNDGVSTLIVEYGDRYDYI